MTAPEPLTPPWAYYRRKGLSEMRPYIAWEPLDGISVSEPDKAWLLDCQSRNADPGGYIARNPRNHADQWYVAQAYFDANFELVEGVPVVPFPFEDAIASIGDLGLVITRLPTGSWAVKDPHSDDCWFGPTLIGALEAVLPELGAPRDPTAELEARDA